jgi:hypothetical protein
MENNGAMGMLVTRVLRVMTRDDYLQSRPQFIAGDNALPPRGHLTETARDAFVEWLMEYEKGFAHGLWHRVPDGIARCSNPAERFHGVVKATIKALNARTLAQIVYSS